MGLERAWKMTRNGLEPSSKHKSPLVSVKASYVSVDPTSLLPQNIPDQMFTTDYHSKQKWSPDHFHLLHYFSKSPSRTLWNG